jgi:poly(3-hydroxybutyrate) depolymerase
MRSRPIRQGLRWAPLLALAAALSLLVPDGSASAAGTLYRASEVAGGLARHDISGVYVSGVSSGGYMAGQLQVAYSRQVKGTAVFGAGPYYCAQDNVSQALYGCMDDLYPTHLAALETDAATWSSYGWVDPASGLGGRPVYVYHGRNDTTVRSSVSDDGVAFWRHFGARVTYDSGSAAGHAWVTPYGVNGCSVTRSPYLNDCGTDPERSLLTTLFGSVAAPNTGPLTGSLVRFSQSDYAVTGSAASLSMGGSGFAYVPAACDAGSCRLMVALHGCKQGYDAIGREFVDRSGLNQYADTNRMIVLYPQATASGVNPDGCWDWWGYLGATNYPIHGGYQVETIMNMVSALGG